MKLLLGLLYINRWVHNQYKSHERPWGVIPPASFPENVHSQSSSGALFGYIIDVVKIDYKSIIMYYWYALYVL